MHRFGLSLIALLLFACADCDNTSLTDIPELAGSWLLVEQYADPGDGSGDFEDVDSDKTLQFLADGIFRSNGSLCNMDQTTGPKTSGKYLVNDTLTEFSLENYLLPEGCDFKDSKVSTFRWGISYLVVPLY